MNIIKKVINSALEILNNHILRKNIAIADQHIIPEPIIEEKFVPRMTDYDYLNSYERHESYLEKLGVPMNPLEYKELFKQLINEDNFINNVDNFNILKNIHADMKLVNEKIQPLKDLGLNLTLDITGGCVRDFVLGKPIKDLDVMLSFNDAGLSVSEYPENSEPSILDEIDRNSLLGVGFTEEDLSRVGWENFPIDIKKTKLLELCFLDNIEKVFILDNKQRTDSQLSYDHKGEVYTEIFKDRLCGIVKVDMKSNYKIDILLTDLKKYQFMEEFDINLCKASFSFINDYMKKDFPANPKELLARFSAPTEFFADIFNKKLTVNVNSKSPRMLDAILDNHAPRVQEKYPDYEMNIVSAYNLKPELLSYVNKKLLNEVLPSKSSESPRRKI